MEEIDDIVLRKFIFKANEIDPSIEWRGTINCEYYSPDYLNTSNPILLIARKKINNTLYKSKISIKETISDKELNNIILKMKQKIDEYI